MKIRSIVFHKKKRLLVYNLFINTGKAPVPVQLFELAVPVNQDLHPLVASYLKQTLEWRVRYGSLRQSPQLSWGHSAWTNKYFTLKVDGNEKLGGWGRT